MEEKNFQISCATKRNKPTIVRDFARGRYNSKRRALSAGKGSKLKAK